MHKIIFTGILMFSMSSFAGSTCRPTISAINFLAGVLRVSANSVDNGDWENNSSDEDPIQEIYGHFEKKGKSQDCYIQVETKSCLVQSMKCQPR